MNCDFIFTQESCGYNAVCKTCGYSRNVKRLPFRRRCVIANAASSVGSQLKNLLAFFGIKATDCRCNARAAIMNSWSVQQCEENIDTIVGWLAEEAASRGVPFLNAVGRLLVKRAIHNARKATPH
jgi:hypothetical protein